MSSDSETNSPAIFSGSYSYRHDVFFKVFAYKSIHFYGCKSIHLIA